MALYPSLVFFMPSTLPAPPTPQGSVYRIKNTPRSTTWPPFGAHGHRLPRWPWLSLLRYDQLALLHNFSALPRSSLLSLSSDLEAHKLTYFRRCTTKWLPTTGRTTFARRPATLLLSRQSEIGRGPGKTPCSLLERPSFSRPSLRSSLRYHPFSGLLCSSGIEGSLFTMTPLPPCIALIALSQWKT